MQIIKKILFLTFLLTGAISFSIDPGTFAIAASAIISSTYPLVKDGWQHFFPSVEQQINSFEIEEKIQFIKTRDAFRECLYNSDPKSKRNYFNCPLHCAEMSRAFIACSRKDEMIEMIKNFDLL